MNLPRALSIFLIFTIRAAQAELSPSQQIDLLIEAQLEAKKLRPNPEIDDAIFLRRVSLDLIGRVPTLDESEAFFADAAAGRRERLIDRLLESEGYVSRWYHFWADILRINSRLGINETPAAVEYAYRLWLKQALRENLPYDEFVRQLLTARGHYWENGAVGYHHRDRGMPLDHMANTARIFLGTRLECAQCHDHPFDRWTQMDFYQLAAFSYGMESKGHTHPNREALRAHLERGVDEKRALQIRRAEANLHVRVRYVTTREYDRILQLPHDYQYDNARPFDPVSAKTPFGPAIESIGSKDSRIEAYADWLTSRENPRFTRVIANRLWRSLFGAGIFEPIDDITDNTEVSNPELLAFLEKLLRDLDYDLKAFLAVLCKTKAYQRSAAAPGEPFQFQGPLLRRMSAEQIWDSIAGLATPDADIFRPLLVKQLQAIDRYRLIYEGLAGAPEDEYIATMEALADTTLRISAQLARVYEERTQARVDGNSALAAARGEEEAALKNELGREISRIQKRLQPSDTQASKLADGVSALTSLPKPKYPKPPPGLDPDSLEAWREETRAEYLEFVHEVRKWARASELESPAPRGHFLRDFGQSDRDTIENASDQASIPQALNLLNGPAVDVLTNRFTVLGRQLQEAESSEEKTRLIFQAFLTREPTENELALIVKSNETSAEGLVWALLNTRRFLFIQ